MTEGKPAPPDRRRVTIRDVARAAGVSVAAVSYSFNRPERVAPATRERVLAAAAAVGYRGADPAARALRLGRHGAVALAGPGSVEALLADPVAALVARGLARACDQAGVALVLRGERDTGVDGTVLLRADASLAGDGPAVVVDGDAPEGVPRVLAEVEQGAAAIAAHLAALGHRRLAILSWPGAGPRLEGARRGWGDAGPVHALISPEPHRANGEAAARAALRADPRPDAILGLSDSLALGALDAARQEGLSVPRDLSVAGLDDLPGSDVEALTTVFVPYRPMGDLAGAILASLLEGTDPGSPPPLPTSLTFRATTAPSRS
jgi:DNA-binding LacI/PurR family transcriptional regulator